MVKEEKDLFPDPEMPIYSGQHKQQPPVKPGLRNSYATRIRPLQIQPIPPQTTKQIHCCKKLVPCEHYQDIQPHE